MTQGLDDRIKKEVIRAVSDSHPKLISQELIYQHLENNIQFTDKQKELHHQIRGQIEPNWQHDARNIIHSLKRAGKLICPLPEYYGLPRHPKIEESWHRKIWVNIYQSVKDDLRIGGLIFSTDRENITVSRVGSEEKKTIRENLVCERVNHLVQCGGRLKISSFHKWSLISRGIISLHPYLELTSHKGEECVEIERNNLPTKIDLNPIVFDLVQETESPDVLPSRTVPRDRGESMVSNPDDGGEVRYAWAVLNAEHTWADEGELIHIQDCPPTGQGGPIPYCPTCGQKFVSTSMGSKVFFKHYGHRGSYRKNEVNWPDHAEKTWEEVSKFGWLYQWEYAGWTYQKIHNTLGFDHVNDIEQRRSQYRSNYKAQQSKHRIPVYIHNQAGGNNWEFWAISSSNDAGEPSFSIEGANVQSDGNQFWYLIDDISQTTKVDYADGSPSEDINWPIHGLNSVILTEEGGSGTLNHERHRYAAAETGHYFRTEPNEKQFDVTIGGVRFKRYSRADLVDFEIALPTIGGCIPWLKQEMIVPINITNALNDVTRIYPLDDRESWGIHGEIHLNVDAFVEPLSTRKPAIEMKQTSGDGNFSSVRSLVSMYPAHYIPEPNPSYVSIDGEKFSLGTICFVEWVPEKITFTSDNKEYDFTDSKCNITYSLRNEEQQLLWRRKEGHLEELLQILRDVDAESFTISIRPNSLTLWDSIQITKRLSPSPELNSGDEIEGDLTIELNKAIEKSEKLEKAVEELEEIYAGVKNIEEEIQSKRRGQPKKIPPSLPSSGCKICGSNLCKRPGKQSCKRKARRLSRGTRGEMN